MSTCRVCYLESQKVTPVDDDGPKVCPQHRSWLWLGDRDRRLMEAENVIKLFREFTGWPIGSAHADELRAAYAAYFEKYRNG